MPEPSVSNRLKASLISSISSSLSPGLSMTLPRRPGDPLLLDCGDLVESVKVDGRCMLVGFVGGQRNAVYNTAGKVVDRRCPMAAAEAFPTTATRRRRNQRGD